MFKPVASGALQRPVLGPVLFNIIISHLDDGAVYPQQVCRWHTTKRSGWYTRAVLPYRGTLTDWKNGPTGTSWAMRTAKSCTGGEQPQTSSWKAVCQKRSWGSWCTPGSAWVRNVPLVQRRPMMSWAALDSVLPVGWEAEATSGLCAMSSSGLSTREISTCWREFNQEP